jgi:tripartite-type tricarboxylate transporter receptor subunit TctC
MRTCRLLLASLLLTLGNFACAASQLYPSRPITILLPFAAGGQTDAIARIIAEPMRESLGQPFVLENVSGAGGTIAVGRVARAAPDGYTLILGSQSQFVNSGAVYPLAYDLVTDFEPVALVASSPNLILAKSAVPAKNLEGLIAWIKAHNGSVSQGHVGVASGPHLCGIEMQNRIGARWTFVPYRGGSQAMQDLLGGQIDLYCTTPGSSLAIVRSGQVNAYAITGKRRLAAAPDIPTVDEAGLPGLHVFTWHGLWAPKGTPTEVVVRLNAAVTAALADRGVGNRLADLGLNVAPRHEQTPEALGAFQRAEIEKWWPIIKAANIKPN